jgi:2-polyprenyl-6-methoxyphenol hydroxylase-like FAD-dependent oxidoreductase
VLDRVLATGAPPARNFRLCHGVDTLKTALTPFEGIDYFLCPRRHDLDGILFDTARGTSGVDALDETRLVGLCWQDGRVCGARLAHSGGERAATADLVVGADGRDSAVAKAAGAVEDDVVEPGRYWYYGYFAGSTEPEPRSLTQSESETDTVATMPTSEGLRMVIYGAFNEDYQEFKRDHRTSYLQRMKAHPFIAEMLAGAELVSPVYGFAGVRGYYRTVAGDGWALVGDAAHQKDPVVARGITDALLSAEDLAAELSGGITRDALARYGLKLRQSTGSRMARMMARPDRYMSASQAATFSRELATPEGLARILGLEYNGVTRYEDIFAAGQDEVPGP